MLSKDEIRSLNNFIYNFLWERIINLASIIILFIMALLGIIYYGITNFSSTPSMKYFIIIVLGISISILLLCYIIKNVTSFKKNKNILNNSNFTIEEVVAYNPEVKINKGIIDMKILCSYKNKEGKTYNNRYPSFSRDGKINIEKYNNKEGYLIRFTDELSFIMVK